MKITLDLAKELKKLLVAYPSEEIQKIIYGWKINSILSVYQLRQLICSHRDGIMQNLSTQDRIN